MPSKAKWFAPDERCLGGAHEIESEYQNMHKKITEAKPRVADNGRRRKSDASSRPMTARSYQSRSSYRDAPPTSMADRLSMNRARRRATTDMTFANHYNNLYHLQRRIEEQDSQTERKKNPYDVDIYPTHKNSTRKSMVCQDVATWLPRADRDRPSTSPSKSTEYYEEIPGEGYSEQEFDIIDSPCTFLNRREQKAKTQRENISYEQFRDTMLKEIIDRRMYEEEKIKGLFKDYLRSNPPEHRRAISRAIEDLKQELDVEF
ncbi:hypothetical protein BSKO_02242 [Bryopsis sp. KO-2023]|nr:hypothetical protein BSKO_02242 [Bryopsis sp. KO-2023]